MEEARGNWKRAAELYRDVAAFHLQSDPRDGHEPAKYYLGRARELDAGQQAPGSQRPGGDVSGT